MSAGLPQLASLQLDVPYSGGKFFMLPKHLPGRVNTDDFVYFNLPAGLNPAEYMVAIDSLDTAGPSRRTIGRLIACGVELPHVMLGAHANIYVLPANDCNKPGFWARLNRGSTYTIHDVRAIHRPGMVHSMTRHGILTAGW